ncbi:MAG: tetratricopeptide repeat protein [Gemmatimonadaceae bacterium]|nr:tetratricopeptide repeat protein [Gemmatimonadaceae bacterium]
MASTARIDELKKKFDENPRRYFAPLANEFRKVGEIEQAIMICEEFLPQQPGHMSGHIVYGQALFEAARLDEARTVFETALTLDPENLIALRHLGDIAKSQGDLDSARRWYDRVLEADPRNDEIQALIASLDETPAAVAPAETAPEPVSAPVAEEQRFAPPAIPERPAPTPPPLPEPIELDIVGDVSTAMPTTIPVQPTARPDASVGTAEGLESVEFAPPPAGSTDRAHDLGAALEAGEFTAPAAPIAPLEGLEETNLGAFERIPDGGPPLPMLDTSEPSTPRRTPPAAEAIPDVGPSTLEFSVPTAAERAAVQGRAETSTMPELEPEGDSLPDARPSLPPELPPPVIAAEAELMDLGDPIPAGSSAASVSAPPPLLPPAPPGPEPVAAAAPAPEPAWEPEPVPAREPARAPEPAPVTRGAPFVTETMAELFVKQGFREQALEVYRQLLAANPHDARLQQRLADLQPAAPAAPGESVRDFFGRLAVRHAWERATAAAPPSDEDFTSLDGPPPPRRPTPPASYTPQQAAPAVVPKPAPATAPVSAPAPSPARQTPSGGMSSGLERGASTQGSGGSIDALFGTRPNATSEDSAASALAQAFGGASEPPTAPPAITGRPARAAAGELSLDSVFRDAPPRPPRTAQNFSFDQVFAPDSAGAAGAAAASPAPASDAAAPTEPAERSEDDIEQFNSWLQGLKPK